MAPRGRFRELVLRETQRCSLLPGRRRGTAPGQVAGLEAIGRVAAGSALQGPVRERGKRLRPGIPPRGSGPRLGPPRWRTSNWPGCRPLCILEIERAVTRFNANDLDPVNRFVSEGLLHNHTDPRADASGPRHALV